LLLLCNAFFARNVGQDCILPVDLQSAAVARDRSFANIKFYSRRHHDSNLDDAMMTT
jgi:hypothetical protein